MPPPADTSGHDLLAEALAGLRGVPRTLPCALLYDEAGAALFDEISRLPQYYVTRTEVSILHQHLDLICDAIGPDAVLIELGSGSAIKTEVLLERLLQRGLPPRAYCPLDISLEQLAEVSGRLRRRFPTLEILPSGVDYTRMATLPADVAAALGEPGSRAVAYFPGSTIGNFHPGEAGRFLRRLGDLLGSGGRLVVGYDRYKDRGVLLPAYDDQQGVTARFNLNLLSRLQRDFEAELEPRVWRHEARWVDPWDAGWGRIEMHLVAQRATRIQIAGQTFDFGRGETIWTESSYKHERHGFDQLLRQAGFRGVGCWSDPKEWFTVQAAQRD